MNFTADTHLSGLDNGRAVRNRNVEAAREYELPQHRLGDESDSEEDDVKDTENTERRRPTPSADRDGGTVPFRDVEGSSEVDSAPGSGRRLI